MKVINLDELTLRAPEPEDINFILRLENDAEMMNVANATGMYSRYQIQQYIENNQNDLYADRQLRFMIVHPVDECIGAIDLFSFEPRHSRIEVGIAVMAGYRRKGVARWALAQVEQYCFRRLNLHQIYAYVAATNEASIRLFEQCGYRQAGVLQDWIAKGRQYHDVFVYQKLNNEDTVR